MQIKPARPYDAEVVQHTLWRERGNKSTFKVYFVSILGRQDRARYEWCKFHLSPDQFIARLEATHVAEGVGFITAFPHITKIFRFAPASETVLHVKACETENLSQLNLGRDDKYVEYACYAEAALAAEEYDAWARAQDMAEYLSDFSKFTRGTILFSDKLKRYWEQ